MNVACMAATFTSHSCTC